LLANAWFFVFAPNLVAHIFVVDLFSVQLTKQHSLYFFDLNSKFYVTFKNLSRIRTFFFGSSAVRQFASKFRYISIVVVFLTFVMCEKKSDVSFTEDFSDTQVQTDNRDPIDTNIHKTVEVYMGMLWIKSYDDVEGIMNYLDYLSIDSSENSTAEDFLISRNEQFPVGLISPSLLKWSKGFNFSSYIEPLHESYLKVYNNPALQVNLDSFLFKDVAIGSILNSNREVRIGSLIYKYVDSYRFCIIKYDDIESLTSLRSMVSYDVMPSSYRILLVDYRNSVIFEKYKQLEGLNRVGEDIVIEERGGFDCDPNFDLASAITFYENGEIRLSLDNTWPFVDIDWDGDGLFDQTLPAGAGGASYIFPSPTSSGSYKICVRVSLPNCKKTYCTTLKGLCGKPVQQKEEWVEYASVQLGTSCGRSKRLHMMAGFANLGFGFRTTVYNENEEFVNSKWRARKAVYLTASTETLHHNKSCVRASWNIFVGGGNTKRVHRNGLSGSSAGDPYTMKDEDFRAHFTVKEVVKPCCVCSEITTDFDYIMVR
jgi:hypothetical protein